MRRKNLICGCCGKPAGKYHQWFNQDAGVGICSTCQDWQLSTGAITTNGLRETYGVAGVNRPISIQDRLDALEEKLGGLVHGGIEH